jgi:tripartite-type tricarboxylate transporter receptor subunit TctC
MTRITSVVVSVLMILVVPFSFAQTWPTKPVRFVLGAPAGTAPDTAARIVGERLTAGWGQQIVIENRPGAGGMIAMDLVKASPADGYTIMFTHAGAALVTPQVFKAAKYDPVADYVTLGFIADSPMVIAVSNSLKEKTLAELLKTAKEQPGKITIGSTEQATLPYLVAAALAQSAGASVVQVPYSKPQQAIQGLVSGDVPIYVDGVAPLLALIRDGKIRALAVTSDRPLAGLENIPLVKDAVPGYSAVGWFALQGPKAIPNDVATKINRDLNEALTHPEVVTKLRNLVLFPSPRSLPESAAFMKSEVERWAKVIKSANIAVQ